MVYCEWGMDESRSHSMVIEGMLSQDGEHEMRRHGKSCGRPSRGLSGKLQPELVLFEVPYDLRNSPDPGAGL